MKNLLSNTKVLVLLAAVLLAALGAFTHFDVSGLLKSVSGLNTEVGALVNDTTAPAPATPAPAP